MFKIPTFMVCKINNLLSFEISKKKRKKKERIKFYASTLSIIISACSYLNRKKIKEIDHST